jgi:hypothetical protein
VVTASARPVLVDERLHAFGEVAGWLVFAEVKRRLREEELPRGAGQSCRPPFLLSWARRRICEGGAGPLSASPLNPRRRRPQRPAPQRPAPSAPAPSTPPSARPPKGVAR